VALTYVCGDALDVLARTYVADFVLAADFLCERAEPIFTSRERHGQPALLCKRADEGGADAARGSGDDGGARQRQTRSSRAAENVAPAESVATAASLWCPRGAKRGRHVPV